MNTPVTVLTIQTGAILMHVLCLSFDSVASPPHLASVAISETSAVIELEKPNYSPKEGLVYGFNVYYSYGDDKGH